MRLTAPTKSSRAYLQKQTELHRNLAASCGHDRQWLSRSWSMSDIRQLKHFHGLGYSPAQIALALNRSRNSILGKANRMGLSFQKEQPQDLAQLAGSTHGRNGVTNGQV